MELIKFRVTEFRSVKDSGWIDADRITALIGTNESGKTNILLPLWKLNPAREGKIDLLEDLPRSRYSELRNAKQKPTFITAIYLLEEQERKKLAEVSQHDESEFNTVQVSRDFDGNYKWDFPDVKDDLENKKQDIISILKDFKNITSKKDISAENNVNEIKIEKIISDSLKNIKSSTDIVESVHNISSSLSEVKSKISSAGNVELIKELLEKCFNHKSYGMTGSGHNPFD